MGILSAVAFKVPSNTNRLKCYALFHLILFILSGTMQGVTFLPCGRVYRWIVYSNLHTLWIFLAFEKLDTR